MAYTDLRTGLVTILESVSDIGVVHNRMRWGNTWSELLDLLRYTPTDGSDTVMRGWMISRAAVEEDESESVFGAAHRQHTFLIRGIMAFSDPNDSEGTFNALVDTVVSALKDDASYENADADFIPNAVTVNVPTIEIRMFGQVLAHYCEIQVELTVEELD